MHNIVIVSNKEQLDLLNESRSQLEIHYVKSVKAAIIYQIECPEIDAIVYDADTIDHRELLTNLEKSLMINPLILQFLIGDISLPLKVETNKSIILINNINEVVKVISQHKINRRQSNRAKWPIQVKYHKKEDSENGKWGMILSISVGGCFIKTEHLELGKKGDIFTLNIHFKDFNFLVEGEIVRIQRIADINSPQGFSIKFISPTPQTKEFIQEIINNKILSTIFSDFNHLEGSLF